ncbi:hypothetical protein PCASD_02049 [Puccinia coronata f. sp. avenae]|uniref:Uncharacterized protein n=1 Tax=Puccinia coronata f. sp. avenae TaxID=200324 RepID=A0A2N5VPX2_9BASI|nr:hypothetical protein PCASD_02049 [Puccinia coronata f. sp. avenae]
MCAHPSCKQVKPVSNQCQLVLSEKDDSMMTPALGFTVDATGGPCTQTVKIRRLMANVNYTTPQSWFGYQDIAFTRHS